jgi:hypothetical protein
LNSIRLLFIIAVGLLLGCKPNPRYRTGEARPPDVSDKEYKGHDKNNGDKEDRHFQNLPTLELIELGGIIQSYLGKPSSGQTRHDEGLDCSRFTQLVFEEFNYRIRLPRTAAEQFKESARIGKNNIRFGDLVFFCTDGRDISHVGIYIGYNEFIHSSSSSGVIITDMDDKYWKKKIVGLGRVLTEGK